MFEESDNGLRTATVEEMREVLASISMPQDAKRKAADELEALSYIRDSGSGEYRRRAQYVSCLLSMPWSRVTGSTANLARLKRALDQSLPSLPQAAQTICDYIERMLSHMVSKPKILVVDDEKIALSSIERALKKEGYTVVAESSGAGAIEQLNSSHFDVVITDLIMGDVDGYAVLLETRKKYPDTRLIMITGYATVDTAVQALRMGAFHYIEKPLKLDEVREAVRDALKERAAPWQEPVLCFTGPAGEEKIAAGSAVAEALERKLVRISLAEIQTEGQLRGEHRLNEGALPGRVIQEIHSAGSCDPVVMLEDADRIAPEMKDTLVHALAEVLNPDINRNFTDRYLAVPFDLSQILFILTSDDEISIPRFPGVELASVNFRYDA